MAEGAQKPKKMMQIVGAIAATMGGLTLGTVIGWSSPAHSVFINSGLVTKPQFTHISSVMCLGAAAAQPYIFLTIDRVGRKWTMIIVAIPIIIFYMIMGIINNWIIILISRFCLGFCAGAFCVAAPTYIGEYSDKHIRGMLGVMFQLLLVIGIELSYVLGLFENRYALCFPLVLPPAICIIMMVFLPESPVLLKMKGKEDKMKQALIFYRGKDYDITQDEKDIESYIKTSEGSFKENIKKKATINGFLMLLVMHVVQQLSGINAIMFYAAHIFEEGNFFSLSSTICVVILGAFQIVAVSFAAGVVDKLGRRLLWLISLGIMAVCLIVTGIYFIINAYDTETASKIQFILVICICLYVFGFCFGTGPLPWAMVGEMLSAAAKSYTAPVVAAVNWLLAYLVTVSYPYLKDSVGDGPVFLGYALVCILGFIYVLFILIETKDRTLDEIQIALGSKKPDA